MSNANLFIAWWAIWHKHVANWASRGIESRKHGELVERLALEESPEFASEFHLFQQGEPKLDGHWRGWDEHRPT